MTSAKVHPINVNQCSNPPQEGTEVTSLLLNCCQKTIKRSRSGAQFVNEIRDRKAFAWSPINRLAFGGNLKGS